MKHRKFDHLWKGPYKIVAFRGKNSYILEEMEGGLVLGPPVNGRLLKHYFFFKQVLPVISLYIPCSLIFSCLDSPVVDSRPEVKEVRSTGRSIISFLFFFFPDLKLKNQSKF